ncbi:hypothetical protein B9Z55_021336 [Caenorhabditis nigoni]|uniref:Serpentine receptor class gamma n=1 Tax=Caenorhabditis nigoni TaxID=1611254 RepID=A0A2G5TRI8_9PELO|nr:hypothetical protein B9Z55_021336 [Caenorhabditis nigoni]
MNVSFFASALLYIPIMISVHKMSHLRSVQESKPQIYIFWQTMTALIAKIIHTSLFIYILSGNLQFMILFTRAWDVFCVPVIIQISYLTCNRQNVVTLFASFKGRKLIRELITPEVTSTTLVYPMIDHFYGMMKKTYATNYFMYVMAIYIAVKFKEHMLVIF